MSENNPRLLACGHIVTDFFDLRWSEGSREIRCPNGCGWQRFVEAPDLDMDEVP
jgi:hypothetical protein